MSKKDAFKPPADAPIVGERYINNKSGTIFRVIRVGKFTEFKSFGVVYERISPKTVEVLISSLEYWNGQVVVEGEQKPRFSKDVGYVTYGADSHVSVKDVM